jgi:hypothetical protein
MENLVWLIENFIYGDISAERDEDLLRAFAAKTEFNALRDRFVEAQRELAKAKNDRDEYKNAAIALYNEGLLSSEMCAKLEAE